MPPVRPNFVTHLAAFAATMALLCAVPVAGAMARELDGQVVATSLEAIEVDHAAGVNPYAFNFFPGEDTLSNLWILEAEGLIVNWSREDGVRAGTPGSGGSLVGSGTKSDQGEVAYANSVATFPRLEASPSLLLVGDSGRLSAIFTGIPDALVTPSPGETWFAGQVGQGTSSEVQADAMHGTFEVAAGTPSMRFSEAHSIAMEGDFTLYVWSAFLQVRGADGDIDQYDSGTWESSGEPLGSSSPVRQTHLQLLRLEVTGGSLVLPAWSGTARLASEGAQVSVTERAEFNAADAYLETAEHFFRAENEAVSLTGSMELNIRPSYATAEQLIVSVHGDLVDTTLPPDGPVPPASAGNVRLVGADMAQSSGQVLSVARDDSSFWLLIVIPVAFIAMLAAIWVIRRWLLERHELYQLGPIAANTPESVLRQAELALVQGRRDEARRLAQQLVADDKHNTDAWFVYGASLLQEGRAAQLIKELRPIAKTDRKKDPALSFLLCLAYVRQGDLSKAAPWADVAAAEPEFRQQMEMDGTLALLRGNAPAPKPAPTPSLVDAAYA